MPSVAAYSYLLLIGATPGAAFAHPVPCEPFFALHGSGAVYARGGKGDAPAPACAAGLKAAVESEASAGKVALSARFGAAPEVAPPPAVQVLQVVFWTQPGVRKVLQGVGAAAAAKGWGAARIFELVAAATVPDAPGPLDLGAAVACEGPAVATKVPTFAMFTPPAAPPPGGAPGLYIAPGTPDAARAEQLAGTHRASFVAVVRETQARSTMGLGGG
jgi:hypothetical protein